MNKVIEFAEQLGDMEFHRTNFEGFISYRYSSVDGYPEMHITSECFAEAFGDHPDIVRDNQPEISRIRKSIMQNGVQVFCLVEASLQMVEI